MQYFVKWFLAYFRISKKAICEMSKNKGIYNDYHDYPDSIEGEAWHFYLLKCRRCGKHFGI